MTNDIVQITEQWIADHNKGLFPVKRIEVRQVHEVSPIIVYGRKYADKFSQTIKTVEYLTDEDGLSYRVGSRDGEDD